MNEALKLHPAADPSPAVGTPRQERSTPAPSTPPPVEALLISDVQAAALAGISRSHLHRLRIGGHWGPRPIKLGRKLLFDRRLVIAWINAGCPDAATFAALQAAEGRRARRVV